MSEQIYTTGEVAKLVGVNFRTVIRWIQRGELPGYQLPGRGDHRVRHSDLVSFMSKHSMPLPSELRQTPSERLVLVVEDEPAMARALERIFLRSGWKVLVAADGFQAGAMLVAHQPCLMTLDLRMPGMDGFEVLRFTRKHFTANELKIIVISAQPEADLVRACDNGADAAFPKPFENQDLLEQASQLVAMH